MAYLGAYAQLPPMTPAQLLKAQQAQAAGHAAATDPLIEPKYTANVLVTTGSSPSTPSASQPYGNGNVWGTATPLQPAPNLPVMSSASSSLSPVAVGNNARNTSVSNVDTRRLATGSAYSSNRDDQADEASYFLTKNPILKPTVSPTDEYVISAHSGIKPGATTPAPNGTACTNTASTPPISPATNKTCQDKYTSYVVICSEDVKLSAEETPAPPIPATITGYSCTNGGVLTPPSAGGGAPDTGGATGSGSPSDAGGTPTTPPTCTTTSTTSTDATTHLTCPEGAVIDTEANTCTITTETVNAATAVYSCPNDYVLSGTDCQKGINTNFAADLHYTCPNGGELSADNQACVMTFASVTVATQSYYCPPPTTLNDDGKTCSDKTSSTNDPIITYNCPLGATLSEANQCITTNSTYTLATATYSCPPNSTPSDATGQTCDSTIITTNSSEIRLTCLDGETQVATWENGAIKINCETVTSTTTPATESLGCLGDAKLVNGSCETTSVGLSGNTPTVTSTCPDGSTPTAAGCTGQGPDTIVLAIATYSCKDGSTPTNGYCSGSATTTHAVITHYTCPANTVKVPTLRNGVAGVDCQSATTTINPSQYGGYCLNGGTLSQDGTKCEKLVPVISSNIPKATVSCTTGTFDGANCVNEDTLVISSSDTTSKCFPNETLTNGVCEALTPGVDTPSCDSGMTMSTDKKTCTGVVAGKPILGCPPNTSIAIVGCNARVPATPTGYVCSKGTPTNPDGNGLMRSCEYTSTPVDKFTCPATAALIDTNKCLETTSATADTHCPDGLNDDGTLCYGTDMGPAETTYNCYGPGERVVGSHCYVGTTDNGLASSSTICVRGSVYGTRCKSVVANKITTYSCPVITQTLVGQNCTSTTDATYGGQVCSAGVKINELCVETFDADIVSKSCQSGVPDGGDCIVTTEFQIAKYLCPDNTESPTPSCTITKPVNVAKQCAQDVPNPLGLNYSSFGFCHSFHAPMSVTQCPGVINSNGDCVITQTHTTIATVSYTCPGVGETPTAGGGGCTTGQTTTETTDAVISHFCLTGTLSADTQTCYNETVATTIAIESWTCSDGTPTDKIGSACSETSAVNIPADVVYSCLAGGTLNSTSGFVTCSYPTTTVTAATTTSTCANGETPFGGGCMATITNTTPATVSYTCGAGITPTGGSCTVTTVVTTIPTKTSYCPTGTPDATGETCTTETAVSIPANASYACPNGGTPSGGSGALSICENTTTSATSATPSYSCPSGSSYWWGKCHEDNPVTTPATLTYSCPHGGTLSGEGDAAICTQTTDFTSISVIAFTCPTDSPPDAVLTVSADGRSANCSSTMVVIPATVSYSCGGVGEISGTGADSVCTVTEEVTTIASSGLACPDGGQPTEGTCNSTTSTVSAATASLVCPTGYTLDGVLCNGTGKIKPLAVSVSSCGSLAGFLQ